MAAPEEPAPALPAGGFGFGLVRKTLMVLADNILSLPPPTLRPSPFRTSYSSLLSSFRSLTQNPRVFVGECSACAIREQQVGVNSIRKLFSSPSASGLETISLQGDVVLTSIDFSSACVRVRAWACMCVRAWACVCVCVGV